jgi:5-methylcytosine-specific restriction endonuclease McrA
MNKVEVLNYADVPMYFVDWTEAMGNVFVGRAEVVEVYEDLRIGIVGGSIPHPKIIKFKSLDSVTKSHKRKVIRFTRVDLFARDEGRCQYCEKQLTKEISTIDHVVPRSRGGATSWENCVISCADCNGKKGSRTPHEAGMNLLKTPGRPQKIIREFGRKNGRS